MSRRGRLLFVVLSVVWGVPYLMIKPSGGDAWPAVLAGVLVLGEPLSVLILVAFGLILAGSVLATSRDVSAAQPHRGGNPVETGVR